MEYIPGSPVIGRAFLIPKFSQNGGWSTWVSSHQEGVFLYQNSVKMADGVPWFPVIEGVFDRVSSDTGRFKYQISSRGMEYLNFQ